VRRESECVEFSRKGQRYEIIVRPIDVEEPDPSEPLSLLDQVLLAECDRADELRSKKKR
jgi:hypothetical protein